MQVVIAVVQVVITVFGANDGQGGFLEDLDGDAAALSPACTTAAQAAVDPTWITHLRKAISTYNTQVGAAQASLFFFLSLLWHSLDA